MKLGGFRVRVRVRVGVRVSVRVRSSAWLPPVLEG